MAKRRTKREMALENLFENVAQEISNSVTKWHKYNTPKVIQEKVNTALNKAETTLIGSAIGFSNSYGKWEVDHCNGRSGESLLGDYLSKNISDGLTIFLKKLQLKLPEPTQTMIKAAKDDYQKEFDKCLSRIIKEKAREAATNTTNKLLEDLEKSFVINGSKYTKLLNLLK